MPVLRHRTGARLPLGTGFLVLLLGLGVLVLTLPTRSSARALRVTSALGSPEHPGLSAPHLKTHGSSGHWHLIFNANFQNRAPDPRVWWPSWFGSGSGISGPINGLETACYNAANVQTSPQGVNLVVNRTHSTCQGQTRPYTGALLSTNPDDGRRSGGFQYTYGVLQARLYLPATGKHIANWPALMTLGQGANGGENDIIEGLFGKVCAHYHAPGIAGTAGLGGCDNAFKPGWHVITMDWEPGRVTWYYDGREYDQVTQDIDSAPQYITMVNTTSSFAPGDNKPGSMTVAWIKVWQQST